MKAQLFGLVAASLLITTHAQALPSDLQDYIDGVHSLSAERLAARGVPLAGRSLEVKTRITDAGDLNNVRVSRSSGSLDADAAARTALSRLHVGATPTTLSGRDITLRFAGDDLQTATRAP